MATDPQQKYSFIKIGDAAKLLGISQRTLRRWEEAGKLIPVKTPGGTRLYRLDQIQKSKSGLLKIGEAAFAAGISVKTLRRWEEQGKLTAVRTPGGTRLYSIEAIKGINPHGLLPQPISFKVKRTTSPTPTFIAKRKNNFPLPQPVAQHEVLPTQILNQPPPFLIARPLFVVIGTSFLTSFFVTLLTLLLLKQLLSGQSLDSLILSSSTLESLGSPSVLSATTDNQQALQLLAGTDIAVEGSTINNTATLESVYTRGGCKSCLTDSDITNALSISSSGSVDPNSLAAVVPLQKGGTGLSEYLKGELLYSLSKDTLAKLAPGTNNQILAINSSGLPNWIDISSIDHSPNFSDQTIQETLSKHEQKLEAIASTQASVSANLKVDSLTSILSLTSTGLTQLAQTNIAGKLTVGTVIVEDSQSSISSPGTLKLQNNPLATKLDLFSGALIVTKTGDLTTNGVILAKEIQAPKLTITNASEATSSGALSSSAGVSIIGAGDTTSTVETSSLSSNSLIFVSAVDSPVAVSAIQIDEDQFEIHTNQALSDDLRIRWWVIN